jgi:succinate dehydrogenase hydrophobic anchor subunit
MSSRTYPRVGLSFEYAMWLFTRVSAGALIMLAIVGIAGAFIMGARLQMDVGTLMRWTFFPNPNHVVNSDIPDVAIGWATAYWQIMQFLIVFFGVTHGVNGLRVVIEDYLGPSWKRVVLRGLLFIFWLFMLFVASYVILAS